MPLFKEKYWSLGTYESNQPIVNDASHVSHLIQYCEISLTLLDHSPSAAKLVMVERESNVRFNPFWNCTSSCSRLGTWSMRFSRRYPYERWICSRRRLMQAAGTSVRIMFDEGSDGVCTTLSSSSNRCAKFSRSDISWLSPDTIWCKRCWNRILNSSKR